MKTYGGPHRSGIGSIPLLALTHIVFRLVIHTVVHKTEHKVARIIRDIRHIPEGLLETGFKEPVVG